MFWKPTRSIELVASKNIPAVPEPIGAGYGILFDTDISTAGFDELRLWVHLFVP